jgi:hypothetical protein
MPGFYLRQAQVAHGRERALDRVRGPKMFPMLGREVVERQEDVAILSQAIDGLLVFRSQSSKNFTFVSAKADEAMKLEKSAKIPHGIIRMMRMAATPLLGCGKVGHVPA